jgi:hypothetical protein
MSSSFFDFLFSGTAKLLRSIASQVGVVARWSRDNAGFIIKWVSIAVVAFVVLKGLLFYLGYEMALGYLWGTLGFDKIFAKPIALFVAVLALAFGPTVLWYALYWKRKRELVMVGAIVSVTLLLGAFFTARDVFADRISGVYTKCYLKTLEGFKFSSTCDFDPETGVQFQKMTPEVMEEYTFWKKNGKFASVPALEEGKFFDLLTGKPIVWYVERSNGRIVLSPLPGFDPVSGVRLKPITREVVEQYNLEGSGQSVSRITPPVSSQQMSRLTKEVEDALEYILYVQSSFLEPEDSKSVVKARSVVWEWYATQKVSLIGERVGLDLVEALNPWPSLGTAVPRVYRVSFQVERVVLAGEYVLIAVACTNDSPTSQAHVGAPLQLLDRNSHTIFTNGRIDESPFVLKTKKIDVEGRGYYILRLNPGETSRMLFVLKDVDYGKVRSGYLVVGNEVIPYGVAPRTSLDNAS